MAAVTPEDAIPTFDSAKSTTSFGKNPNRWRIGVLQSIDVDHKSRFHSSSSSLRKRPREEFGES